MHLILVIGCKVTLQHTVNGRGRLWKWGWGAILENKMIILCKICSGNRKSIII